MDFVKMVAALREERARLEEVIIALERLARGQGTSAPGSAASLDDGHAHRGTPTRTSTGKQEQSEDARRRVAALLLRGSTVPSQPDHLADVSLPSKPSPAQRT